MEEAIHILLSDVFSEIHRQYNHNETVVYPYGTFTTSIEAIDRDTEGVYLDIDLFDRHTNDDRLMVVEYKLRKALSAKQLLTEDLLLRFQFVRSTDVSTNDSDIKRRKLSFYIKLNRR